MMMVQFLKCHEMKKTSKIVVLGLLAVAGSLNAQTMYDANRLMQADLNGTARFVGMGGAMGALGGDLSTMGTNPAGIGIYRSHDMAVSFGFNRANSQSNLNGNVMDDGRTKGSFDNAGFVFSQKISNKGTLRYVNFGFNYQRLKPFNKQMTMGGEYLSGVSQTDQMAAQTDGLLPTDFDGDPWSVLDIGWLSILGWQGALTYQTSEDERKYTGFPSETLPYGDFSSTESGGINAFDFNLAFNLLDRVYLGFTLGIYSVDYSRYTWYREGFDYTPETGDRSFYTKEDNFRTTGTGVDFKLGIIARPFDGVPLRIGAAVHTPTRYALKDVADCVLLSDLDYDLNEEVEYYDVYTPDGGSLTEYTIVTPWKYNVSLGYTVGSKLAIGAEYEFSDYSTAKIKDYAGTELGEADEVLTKQFMKGVHTIRAGFEYNPLRWLAIRGGYNHVTQSMDDGAYKVIPYEGPNSVRTDTEYANPKALNVYTAGLGFRGGMFYADVTYQFKKQWEDFFPFDNTALEATSVKNVRHQVLFTLGLRF